MYLPMAFHGVRESRTWEIVVPLFFAPVVTLDLPQIDCNLPKNGVEKVCCHLGCTRYQANE